MARADRRRAKRTRQAPGIRSSGGASAVEQTLFFSRLRRQAKWAFVLLALVFGVGFVVFGVGSDVPGGVADILQGRAPGSGPSLEEARERVAEDPLNAQALRELATALQTEGRADEAIPHLQRYTRLRPRDEAALRELATLYLARAGRLRAEAQAAQLRAQALAPGTDFLPPPSTDLGQALGEQPVSDAVTQQAQAEVTARFERMQAAYLAGQRVYQRIAVLDPEDASLQLQLADAAVNAGNVPVAIGAYERFLELAPDDPQAELVRQEIKRLQALSGLSPDSEG